MELICGKEAGELFSADIGALDNGTWRLGAGRPAKFEPPQEVRNARTGALGGLGDKMLATRENYEEKLKQAAGNQPGLTLARLLAVIEGEDKQGGLGIKLRKEERADLTAYSKEKSGSSGMIKLAAFLTLVGLPAQTIGAASQASLKVMILNAGDCQ